MSAGAIVAVVAALIIVVAIVAAVVMQRGAGGPGLKRRFGPEYERTLARYEGDSRATRRELAERVKRYGGIEQRVLPAQERERYAAQWTAAQARFVDDPAAAVGAADGLIARLAADLGYPGADSPEHVDALSVHHPHHVHGYREAHAAAAGGGRHGTEDLRKALVAARGLFDGLLHHGDAQAARPAPQPAPGAASERASKRAPGPVAERAPGPVPGPASKGAAEPAPGAVPGEPRTEHKAVLGRRLAALTGRGRTEEER